MKAWIKSNGQLVIQPETETQEYALKQWEQKHGKLAQAMLNNEKVIERTAMIINDLNKTIEQQEVKHGEQGRA